MFQTNLFEETYADRYIREGLVFSTPPVSDATFLSGLSESVHRWFRLTPSYSPELVRFLVRHLDCTSRTLLCDPFLGKGTTIIEAKKLGLRAIGVELNPLLKLASEYALTWEVDAELFSAHARETLKIAGEALSNCRELPIEAVLEERQLKLPAIHNVFRWWKTDALKDLLLIKHIVGQVEHEDYRKLYRLALCSSSIDCANIHRNHPTISFDDHHNRQIDVLKDFKKKLDDISADLRCLPARDRRGEARVALGDSTQLSTVVQESVERVITSPPYPNRFSYIHTTRPQLFFMDVFERAAQSADVDCAAIGGTWGKATSVLYNGVVEPHRRLKKILADIIGELRPRSNLMCNYAVKYFNMMDDHVRELAKLTGEGFRGAYVVGNSRLSGVEIHTEVILAKIFEANGYEVENLLVFRKRGGKKNLYETAVCVRRA